MNSAPTPRLLTGRDVRELAQRFDIRPTKTWGQNFVTDANTIRRIVGIADIAGSRVVEIGPGLGSLTLGLLECASSVIAVEIDPVLAAALPETVAERAPGRDLTVVHADALTLTSLPGDPPTALVANLPYNVAVPVLLSFLERFESIQTILVMVQAEVADRLAAPPGSRTYGVPSAKVAWYGGASKAGRVPRGVFWPVPNVESDLVLIRRGPSPDADRSEVFSCIDAAFAQRRKTLRAALAGWAGSAPAAERILNAAGIDPQERGEQLDIDGFVAIASARASA